MPRRSRQARLPREEYALSPRTRSGRVRGRLGPGRRTRIVSRSGIICGESPAWPAVRTKPSTCRCCSTARWILVDQPPRERPKAWPGMVGGFLADPVAAVASCAGGVHMGAGGGRGVVESTDTCQATFADGVGVGDQRLLDL